MIGSLGPERLANKIRLLRSQFAGAVLIVEGETDARVYKRYVIEHLCHIEVAHNKDAATRGLGILEQEQSGGILAIVDADFQRLEGQASSSPNLFLTDTHDLETMMLRSPALDKILTEFGSEEKIATLITQMEKSLREILLAAGLPVGYLRWVSLQQNLALKFEELEFGKFVNESFRTDVQKLIHTVKNKSQQHSLNVLHVQKELVALQHVAHDPWQVCCGHDLLEILSLGLRKGWRRGVLNAGEIKATVIERDLRLAYESAFFQTSELCTALQQWEAANPPFRFLAISSDPQNLQ